MKTIDLTQGKVAIVDDEDYAYLNQWKWHYCAYAKAKGTTGYAKRSVTPGARTITDQLVEDVNA
jgi:hypothetical protein